MTTDLKIKIETSELLKDLREIIRQELAAAKAEEAGERLLDAKKACQIFDPAISPQTIYNYAKAGILNKYHIGGSVRYKYSEVIAAAAKQKRYQHNP